MGGPGSGRYPAMMSITDCRCLDIGELAGAGRHQRIPHGRILWRDRESGRTVGRLTYRFSQVIRPADGAPLTLLSYSYWSAPWDAPIEDRLALRIKTGTAIVAYCPDYRCRRPVRKLYAPPGEVAFLCRSCWRLSYPRSQQKQLERSFGELCGTLFAGPRRRPPAEGGPPERRSPEEALALLEELDLDWAPGPEERRIACLQLGAAGFSLRQIAAQTGISKSSVARLLVAGSDAIDLRELLTEREHRYPEAAAQFRAAVAARPRPAEVKLLLPQDR